MKDVFNQVAQQAEALITSTVTLHNMAVEKFGEKSVEAQHVYALASQARLDVTKAMHWVRDCFDSLVGGKSNG